MRRLASGNSPGSVRTLPESCIAGSHSRIFAAMASTERAAAAAPLASSPFPLPPLLALLPGVCLGGGAGVALPPPFLLPPLPLLPFPLPPFPPRPQSSSLSESAALTGEGEGVAGKGAGVPFLPDPA